MLLGEVEEMASLLSEIPNVSNVVCVASAEELEARCKRLSRSGAALDIEEVAKCVALNNEDFDSFAAYLAQIAVSKQGAIPPRRR